MAEVTYVAERERPESAVGDEPEAERPTEGEPIEDSVDPILPPPDGDEPPPAPASGAAELDLFG